MPYTLHRRHRHHRASLADSIFTAFIWIVGTIIGISAIIASFMLAIAGIEKFSIWIGLAR